MEAPRLITPSAALEASYRAYVAEVQALGERLIPFQLQLPNENFAQLLDTLDANSKGDRLPERFVPNSTYWLVVESQIVGVSNLRHRLVPALEVRGGHIGYSVRPSSRRRGYGTELLKLTLLEAKRMGIHSALITCAKDNPGSAKVILANGGVLVSEEHVAEYNEVVQRYVVQTVLPNSRLEDDAAVPALRTSARAPQPER